MAYEGNYGLNEKLPMERSSEGKKRCLLLFLKTLQVSFSHCLKTTIASNDQNKLPSVLLYDYARK